jgi:hypothetical protein
MPPRPIIEQVRLEVPSEVESVSADQKHALITLRITNAGSHPIEVGEIRATCLQEGRGVDAPRTWSRSRAETPGKSTSRVSPLSNPDGLIMPGRSQTMPLLVGVPEERGTYAIRIQIDTESAAGEKAAHSLAECLIKLHVTEHANPLPPALADLAQLCRLPEGYEHEANGRVGRLKAWLKEKLLGGFRRRYVDVLSRQQSAANRLILTAIAGLNASVARLERSGEIENSASRVSVEVLDRIRKLECRVAELEEAQSRVMS